MTRGEGWRYWNSKLEILAAPLANFRSPPPLIFLELPFPVSKNFRSPPSISSFPPIASFVERGLFIKTFCHQGTFNPAVITNKEVHMVHGNINTNDETSHTTILAMQRRDLSKFLITFPNFFIWWVNSAARARCFQGIHYVALLQEWTTALDEKLQSDIRGRIIGCQAQMNTFDFFFELNLGCFLTQITYQEPYGKQRWQL